MASKGGNGEAWTTACTRASFDAGSRQRRQLDRFSATRGVFVFDAIGLYASYE